jgi:hypothetical protein
MFDIAENNQTILEELEEKGVDVNVELVTDDEEAPEVASVTQLVEPIDTDESPEGTSWGTDDDDAEEGTLDEQPDDLASDESRHDRESYWGG